MNAKIIYGVEEIKNIYEQMLNTGTLDIVCFATRYAKIVGDYFDKSYAPRLFNSKTRTREILPDNNENRKDAKQKDGLKNQVRFIKTSKPSESDLIISDDQVVLVSYNQQAPFALVIADKELISGFHNQFTALWEKSER